MRGLRRRIETVIEDVNLEIRVDLGLEQVTPEELERLKQSVDFTDKVPEAEQVEEEQVEEESEEAKAFERVLDEIEARYESIDLEETDEELEESEELEELEEVSI